MSIVMWTRDKIIDRILAEPQISLTQLAKEFGYTVPWLSTVTNSDAFRERLEARRQEMVDPVVLASVKDRLTGVASLAADNLAEKLTVLKDPNLAIKALTACAPYLAPKGQGPAVAVQQNFVAMVPEKARSASEWMAAHAPSAAPSVLEHPGE